MSNTALPATNPAMNTQSKDSDTITSSTATQGATIEQSVLLFKVFEALRSGDTAAITKASRGDGETKLEGTTILHVAIQCAEMPVIEFVLSQHEGAINARDRDGSTPLHIAASLGRASAVNLLLAQKDINDSIANHQAKTPLDLARNPEIFQQLQLARSMFVDSNTARIHQLVARGDYNGLEQLLSDSRVKSLLDINASELATDPATTVDGGTLLHEAARRRDLKLAQMLLLNGADPFRRDRKGKLPQDVTKDERTRAIIKRSPAAAAAQRNIQEKTILGDGTQAVGTATAEGGPGSKESREMKGYLRKWTNYTSGYKLRFFVLEDGVLSYYKHQDDAGSACRGAINMRIAKLQMDPKEKLHFEIHGKSSVKYDLKANHQVEAKRWFWALNNAIQWAKDEAREEEKRHQQEAKDIKDARHGQLERIKTREGEGLSGSAAASSTLLAGSTPGDPGSTYAGSETDAPLSKGLSRTTTAIEADIDADEEDGDDASSHELRPANKDAFSITAQSAKLQLDLLEQVSAALQSEKAKNPSMEIGHPTIVQALSSYETAVGNIKGLLLDLLRISRDHESYWQYRLEREQNVRRLWEDSMARVAKEQEVLETRIGESEDKRKRTKRALKEVLEGQLPASDPESPRPNDEASAKPSVDMSPETFSKKRRATISELTNNEVSDDESEADDEFFDAVDAGEVEVRETMPSVQSPVASPRPTDQSALSEVESTAADRTEREKDISKSYKGYEDGLRKRLKLDADNRPKASLWVSYFQLSSVVYLLLTNSLGHSQIHDWQRHDQDDLARLVQ